MRSAPAAAALALLLSAVAPAAEPTSASDPSPVEVRFADGSVVRMTLLEPAVEIATRYGKLSVPVAEVRRIDFGFRYPEGVEKRIDEAILRLGNGNFRIREAAARDLFALRELAYPALKRAARHPDAEIARRAEDLVRKLEEALPEEKLRFRDYDVVHTADFPIRGRIVGDLVRARTSYFGEVRVPLAEMRTLRSLGLVGGEEVIVDAGKYALPQQVVWMETDAELSADSTLEVQSSGTVDLWPQGGNYKSGPDGQPNFGNVGGYPPGTLLGRVGANGKAFVIGSKYAGTPGEEGKLFLRIVSSPWNNPSVGSYSVKIGTTFAAPKGLPPEPKAIGKK